MNTDKESSSPSDRPMVPELETYQKQIIENTEYKDRKVGLVIFGLVQILIGGVCALFVLLMSFVMIAGSALGEAVAQQGTSPRMMVPGLLFYFFAAIGFVWVGVGTIKARRWARALNLVNSWMILVCGIGGMAFWLILSPNMYEQMSVNGEVPAQMLTVMRHVTTGFLALIYIIGPGAFILFFRSRHVKATCEARDPKTRWTDHCPLPVLAMAIMFAFWGSSGLFMVYYNFAMPFFGSIVSGWTGAIVCVGLAVMGGWIALGAYRLKPAAWWTGFVLSALFWISSILTFSRIDLMEYYKLMDFPEEQLEIMSQMEISTSMMLVPMSISMVFFLSYLFYIKRFFRSESPVAQ